MESTEKDLFDSVEALPKEVQAILEKYSLEDETYGNCEKMLSELKPYGYTFEYGLDAVPSGLRKVDDQVVVMDSMDIDLFDSVETLPKEVQAILEKYSLEDETYGNCEKMLAELAPHGYTFEYYLNAIPYGLRKIGDEEKKESLAQLSENAGNTEAKPIEVEFVKQKAEDISKVGKPLWDYENPVFMRVHKGVTYRITKDVKPIDDNTKINRFTLYKDKVDLGDFASRGLAIEAGNKDIEVSEKRLNYLCKLLINIETGSNKSIDNEKELTRDEFAVLDRLSFEQIENRTQNGMLSTRKLLLYVKELLAKDVAPAHSFTSDLDINSIQNDQNQRILQL